MHWNMHTRQCKRTLFRCHSYRSFCTTYQKRKKIITTTVHMLKRHKFHRLKTHRTSASNSSTDLVTIFRVCVSHIYVLIHFCSHACRLTLIAVFNQAFHNSSINPNMKNLFLGKCGQFSLHQTTHKYITTKDQTPTHMLKSSILAV